MLKPTSNKLQLATAQFCGWPLRFGFVHSTKEQPGELEILVLALSSFASPLIGFWFSLFLSCFLGFLSVLNLLLLRF